MCREHTYRQIRNKVIDKLINEDEMVERARLDVCSDVAYAAPPPNRSVTRC